ncbi:MAG TPA: leucine-rich repeat domain-containing protein, partial [Chthoniobacteraceae bacterium]|nr:leucine-rich repeat domain-containing protein [Chthoniobacteraceae bacterium]
MNADEKKAYQEARRRIRKCLFSWYRKEPVALDLSSMGLTAVPPELGELFVLRELHLSGNQLTTAPAELAKLTDLTKLDLSSNRLTALPTVDRLTSLTWLNLFGNQLAALPVALGNLA